jgi:predicted N-acetyltransferase YhbS
MSITFREMTIDDYEQAYQLWQACPGGGLSSADSREAITAYLTRNPGMSFVAHDAEKLVGTVMAGHDGRRGYLYHLAVAPSHRQQGIGEAWYSTVSPRWKLPGFKNATFGHGCQRIRPCILGKVPQDQRQELVIMSL